VFFDGCVYIRQAVRSTLKRRNAMSLEEFVKPQDMPVFVGSCDSSIEGSQAAICILDFGEKNPSAYESMSTYHKVNLDIQPSPTGHMYYVTSGKIVVELTSEMLERALSSESPADQLRDASRFGTPLFSSCFEPVKENHELFIAARTTFGGCWILIILAQDATEMLILPDGTVYSVTQRERDDYAWVFEKS
jgi:hypothetical protein